MSLFAIGDLHLALGTDKPMDIFGPKWKDHVQKLLAGFADMGQDDVTVLCGDSSWAMTLEGALEDFRFIHALPGKKIILKGNHDYWWTSAAKMNAFLAKNGLTSISILRNNAYPYGENVAICGTKGWFYEESQKADRPGDTAPGGVSAGGGGAGQVCFPPLSAQIRRLCLPAHPGSVPAVRCEGVLLRPSARGQSAHGLQRLGGKYPPHLRFRRRNQL